MGFNQTTTKKDNLDEAELQQQQHMFQSGLGKSRIISMILMATPNPLKRLLKMTNEVVDRR